MHLIDGHVYIIALLAIALLGTIHAWRRAGREARYWRQRAELLDRTEYLWGNAIDVTDALDRPRIGLPDPFGDRSGVVDVAPRI